jgi:uncharacterized RDD family membrane protein YckC
MGGGGKARWTAKVWLPSTNLERTDMSITAPVAIAGLRPVDERASRRTGLARRYVASLVDTLLAYVAVVSATAVAMLVVDRTHSLPLALSAYVVLAGTALIGYPLLTMTRPGRAGQTVGKQLLGIRVVDRAGGRVTLAALLVREVVGKVLLGTLTFGVFGLFSALCVLIDGERRALHDRMAGTLVVRG